MEYFKYVHATEEIQHLNLEISRLWTSIHDEQQYIPDTINALSKLNNPLASKIKCRWTLCSAVQNLHIRHLNKIQELPEFSASYNVGEATKIYCRDYIGSSEPTASTSARTILNDEDEDPDDLTDEEEMEQELEGVEDFITNIE